MPLKYEVKKLITWRYPVFPSHPSYCLAAAEVRYFTFLVKRILRYAISQILMTINSFFYMRAEVSQSVWILIAVGFKRKRNIRGPNG